MSRRPGRWWQPQGPQYRRPSRVSRSRMAYRPDVEWMKGWDQGMQETREAMAKDLDMPLEGDNSVEGIFDAGYEFGQREERKRHEQRDEMLTRLSEACEAASNGDHGPMDEMMREAGFRSDDLLDVAEEAGVTPLDPADVDAMVAELNAELDDLARGLGSKGWIPGEDDE